MFYAQSNKLRERDRKAEAGRKSGVNVLTIYFLPFSGEKVILLFNRCQDLCEDKHVQADKAKASRPPAANRVLVGSFPDPRCVASG